MPLTTTSGYTFPVSGVPTTQSPSSGTSPSANSGKKSYSDYNGDWMAYLTDLANSGDQAAIDRLMNYFMTEQSNLTARNWTASREDTAYQRLVADMKAAGLNPYAFATMGSSPISSSSNGSQYNGSYSSSYEMNKEKNTQNWIKIALSTLAPIIGGLIAAAI